MIKLIAVKGTNGIVRYMRSPARTGPGEEILGAIDFYPEGEPARDKRYDFTQEQFDEMIRRDKVVSETKKELARSGIKWGDAIAWATSKVGMKGCAPCKANQELYNQSLILGLKETARRIKEWAS